MRSFSTLAMLALPLFGSVFAEEPAAPSESIYSNAQEAFRDLLNALPEESLHAALSGLKDFKSGVFESHHRGVERVHDVNPGLATKLIVEAVRDLKKRQNPSNGTVAASPPANTPAETPAQSNSPPEQSNNPPSNSPANTPANTPGRTPAANTPAPPPTPTERAVIIPVQQTTVREGRTEVVTTSILSAVTASVAVVVTRTNPTNNRPETVTEQRPAVIRTVVDSQGRTTMTTSAAQFAPTVGEVRTETDPKGSTFVTTYTPGGGKINSIKLLTTTGADGKPSTITSYTFVDPAQTPAPQAPEGTQGPPGLQTTGAAVANKVVAAYAIAGGAFAMLV